MLSALLVTRKVHPLAIHGLFLGSKINLAESRGWLDSSIEISFQPIQWYVHQCRVSELVVVRSYGNHPSEFIAIRFSKDRKLEYSLSFMYVDIFIINLFSFYKSVSEYVKSQKFYKENLYISTYFKYTLRKLLNKNLFRK